MVTRRDFLKHSSLLALAPTIPTFLAQTLRAAKPERDGRILVVIQLDGGNDGINTVVPFADEGYAKHRKVLRLPKEQLIKVNDRVGLHPSLSDAGKLLESGRLAIVQGVGYPNPNRSHFRSMAIWHTARFDPEEHNGLGWIGRGLDSTPPCPPLLKGGTRGGADAPGALLVGSGSPPVALRGRRSVVSAIERLEEFEIALKSPSTSAAKPDAEGDLAAFVQRSALDAYVAADRIKEAAGAKGSSERYPGTALAERLKLISQLIKAGFGTRVFYTVQSGYDTHAGQLPSHAGLLSELGGAVKAFLEDLTAAKLAERVTLLAFSEFGRTVKENGSNGTDHGTAGIVFLAGARVKSGVVGTMPSLLDLDPKHGDLRMTVDFRQIYATVLQDWLGVAPKEPLAGEFNGLPLIRV